ncbi:hypothetical protein DFH06DRAFT_1216200 [Mycena polygramma]|nr:hypothetical protein DFH06DRAFT_1216200 [Mycena polygramma]
MSKTDTALLELSPLDNVVSGLSFGTAWLLEGELDLSALANALRRVTEKWRLLAGRIVRVNTNWFVEIPLQPLAPDHASYSLTNCEAKDPLSSYLSLPLALASVPLPSSLYMPPSLPTCSEQYMERCHPLVSFHATNFPANPEDTRRYTVLCCVLPHGVFDGVGAALVCRAVVAELNDKPWPVPPMPKDGLQRHVLDAKFKTLPLQIGLTNAEPSVRIPAAGPCAMPDPNAGRISTIILIPRDVFARLVSSVRAQCLQVPEVSSGDVLVAWIIKSLYEASSATAAEGPTPTTVNLRLLSSFRHLFPDSPDISESPHNLFCPFPIPPIPVEACNSKPVPQLAQFLARARRNFCVDDVAQWLRLIQTSAVVEQSHTLDISNSSSWRLLETDWSRLGSRGVVCGYRVLPGLERIGNDSIHMIGRLEDGSVILDTVLGETGARRITFAAAALVQRFS